MTGDLKTSNALIGFAVLRANFNANAPTYFDNFTAFVLAALAQDNCRPVERRTVATRIRETFGIRIPELALGKMLKRTNGAGLTEFVGTEFVSITQSGREQTPATEQLVAFQRRQDELASVFREFVATRFPDEHDALPEDVGAALADYIDRQSVPLLNQSLRGRADVSPTSTRFDYVVSVFIADLSVRDQVRFGYVEEAAKGAILASVLTLDTGGMGTALDRLTLVLDTPILMNLLGYDGEVLQRPALELVEMARAQGAKVIAFQHSLRELDGILEGVEKALRSGRASRSINAAFLNFSEQGKSAVDVALVRADLERHVRDRGVQVQEKPEYVHEHSLDENKLEELLQAKVGYRENSTRLFDVDSLSAVHRMRRGRSSSTLEHCRAVLVTSNTSVVIAANTFERTRDQFSLAIRDEALAGILWVRSSAIDSDVPTKLLLASAYSGMQPSPALWSRYLEEVDELEKREEVSPDEAVVLRATTVSRAVLMEETLGDAGEVTPDLPLVVLQRMRSDEARPLEDKAMQAEARANLAELSADTAAASWLDNVEALQRVIEQRDAAALALSQTEQERDDAVRLVKAQVEKDNVRDERIRQRAKTSASRRLTGLLVGFIIVWLALAVLGIVELTPEFKWLAGVAAIPALVIAGIRTFVPGTVRDWMRPLEAKWAARIERRARRKLALD
ncbi:MULTISPECIES: hypothetical protein [unclassified Microbacterium]|uniref:hypothetical protein n=1 Tax=unclassified Microbacterium TaxID=2609290 RepID=UPI0004930573|nr:MULTISPECIES: hypothetical protein [unclassified Microbacterium]